MLALGECYLKGLGLRNILPLLLKHCRYRGRSRYGELLGREDVYPARLEFLQLVGIILWCSYYRELGVFCYCFERRRVLTFDGDCPMLALCESYLKGLGLRNRLILPLLFKYSRDRGRCCYGELLGRADVYPVGSKRGKLIPTHGDRIYRKFRTQRDSIERLGTIPLDHERPAPHIS